MSNLYYNRQDALSLIDEYKKEVEREIEELDDQLSAFNRQVLFDFIEWIYLSEELEIVCRFK